MDVSLSSSLIDTNLEISTATSMLSSWIIQRAKTKWLHHGEDDLKFLYAKIWSRLGRSKSVVNLFSCNPNTAREEVIHSIIVYFQKLFNPPPPCNNMDLFPIGSAVPNYYAGLLTAPILNDEIKAAVFKGSSNSSPGPDGFNYHFYKTGWNIIGPLVCKAIKSFFF
ncbi:hypothetical protein KFK09_003966 [Dendrobium nobile]|uniref:Uncharacterized protein n=1 Tax=Dendrobium nobile TaxID=94219 RepID=A0A8T3BZ90_DENNO|nr:hypothetical protein KFK09_003966 [Dendrobium nobile]